MGCMVRPTTNHVALAVSLPVASSVESRVDIQRRPCWINLTCNANASGTSRAWGDPILRRLVYPFIRPIHLYSLMSHGRRHADESNSLPDDFLASLSTSSDIRRQDYHLADRSPSWYCAQCRVCNGINELLHSDLATSEQPRQHPFQRTAASLFRARCLARTQHSTMFIRVFRAEQLHQMGLRLLLSSWVGRVCVLVTSCRPDYAAGLSSGERRRPRRTLGYGASRPAPS
ncbi:hypothetical protein OH76DRAFT_1269557 [Lentinus brumalis]|uniref:Uncharacterized protein n=1 Tax=Lentinus brumalis TaxID=2498619 RepID=A0A371CR90_9APHY|nr:hypothetical protein OH76DRAFT_1269557 [Polyporus brumalis]